MEKHEPVKSARGVYYDLTKSPYEYLTPYGDLFKFSSQKKVDIFTREADKEITRLMKLLDRHQLQNYIPTEQLQWMYRMVYHAIYQDMVK